MELGLISKALITVKPLNPTSILAELEVLISTD
jgi:hypothetical protein